MSLMHYLQLRRNEEYGDDMTFAFIKDVSMKDVKELMEKHYPYHPKADSIVLYEKGVEVSDDEWLSSLVLITVSHEE